MQVAPVQNNQRAIGLRFHTLHSIDGKPLGNEGGSEGEREHTDTKTGKPGKSFHGVGKSLRKVSYGDAVANVASPVSVVKKESE
jgi:hypothetical protein